MSKRIKIISPVLSVHRGNTELGIPALTLDRNGRDSPVACLSELLKVFDLPEWVEEVWFEVSNLKTVDGVRFRLAGPAGADGTDGASRGWLDGEEQYICHLARQLWDKSGLQRDRNYWLRLLYE